MKAIIIDGSVKKFTKVPNSWGNVMGGFNNLSDAELQEYGFYNVITPEYNSNTQYLGDLEWDADNSVFTYPVIDRTWSQTLAEMKLQKIKNLEYLYYKRLETTDWIVTKHLELSESIPQDVKDARAELRLECNTKQSEIEALNTKIKVVEYNLPNLD